MRMFCLSADEVEKCWDDIAHHLERLTRCGSDLTPLQARQNALASRQQIWGLQDAEKVHGVCVTEIQQSSQGLVCLIVGACGSAPRGLMERLHDEIAAWAKQLGCTRLRFHGRRGWLRFDRRYKQTGIVAERTL